MPGFAPSVYALNVSDGFFYLFGNQWRTSSCNGFFTNAYNAPSDVAETIVV